MYLKEVSLMQVGIILILQFNHVGNVVFIYFFLTLPLHSFLPFKNLIYPPMSLNSKLLLNYLHYNFILALSYLVPFSKAEVGDVFRSLLLKI